LSPVKIGSVSTLSGPIGATIGGFVKGFQVWVRWINDRGGVNGHPVVLKVWDDGADPARHRAQVQEAVETANVIALVSEVAPTSGEASLEYLKAKNIPVIGTETGSQWPEKSPLYFIQAAWGKGVVYISASAAARRAAATGAKKFGTITCTEAAECALHERYWHQYAVAQGLTSVYKGKSSLVQPDFTAECLAARNAGVEMLALTMDTNSVPRIASSCARQGYHPTYVLLGPLMVSSLTKDPNLDGAVLGTAQFPYVWADNPKVAEFLAAMKTYSPGIPPGPSEAGGWVTAKLFERAAAATPEPPTTAALLDGLWSIRGDSLGGITGPLTFTKGQPSSQNPSCGFDMVLDKGAWTSPDGFKIQCGDPA
jgi:branched-chain amino acid transport system substrate-binding protein